MKKFIAILLALTLVFALTACGEAKTASACTFTVIVTDLDGNSNTFNYTSEAKTVGEALLAEGLISGTEGDYGLYVDTVNGITANWDTDGTYWSFYIGEDYALTGVDQTELTDGASYSFILTKG